MLQEITHLCGEPKAGANMRSARQTGQHGGRSEVRPWWASAELGVYLREEFGWTGAEQAAKVRRQVIQKGRTFQEERYVLTSLSVRRATPSERLDLVRGHWSIVNRLHYVRDVTPGEDANQTRTDSPPQILAALRSAVLNLLRAAGHNYNAAAPRRFAWQPRTVINLLGLGP